MFSSFELSRHHSKVKLVAVINIICLWIDLIMVLDLMMCKYIYMLVLLQTCYIDDIFYHGFW